MDIFTRLVKPIVYWHKYNINPACTQQINDNLICIKQFDVNFYLYKKNNTIIAFDSGYKNNKVDFKSLHVDAKSISHCFLTHLDIDHCGGVDSRYTSIFPNAKIYLNKKEIPILTNEQPRFKGKHIKINNNCYLKKYEFIEHCKEINIDGIKIIPFETLGHTIGHTSYIIDNEILIIGDAISIDVDGHYAGYKEIAMDKDLEIKYLLKLREFLSTYKIKIICTGHFGYDINYRNFLNHVDIIASSKKHRHK